MRSQSDKNSGTHSRELVLATDWKIGTTPHGNATITIETATGKEIVSTSHGACTPVGALREWVVRARTGTLCLPVMEDHTGSIIDVVFPARSPFHKLP